MPEQDEGPMSEREVGLMALRPALNRPEIEDVNYSFDATELTRRVLAMGAHNDRIANFVQGLPTREEHEALVAEHAAMREKLNRLELLLDSFCARAA